MKKLKSNYIVNGTMGGHPFLNHKNHAGGGAAVVPIPTQKSMAKIIGRKMNASAAVVKANSKG